MNRTRMRYPCCPAVGICLLLSTFASATLQAKAPDGEAHVYKTVDDQQLKLYVTRPDDWKATDTRPAIVFFHGGGWVNGQPGQFTNHSKYLASRGMVAIQVQYRLLDGANNDPPVICIQDAKSAMRWVRSRAKELGVDPDRIASAGGSAGGHLAAFVGMVEGHDDPADDKNVSAKSNAMVLFNPVYDNGPRNGWGQGRVKDRFAEFSPAHNISADDPPAIVFVGSDDKLIPLPVAERFHTQLNKAGVVSHLEVFEGKGHGFFNFGKDGGKAYRQTLASADNFLVSLGWLEGENTVDVE